MLPLVLLFGISIGIGPVEVSLHSLRRFMWHLRKAGCLR